MRKWCDGFTEAVYGDFVFRKPTRVRKSMEDKFDNYFIRERDGEREKEIFRCPFCGKKHWRRRK